MPLNDTQKTAIRDVIVLFTENIKTAFESTNDANIFIKSVSTLLSCTINNRVIKSDFRELLNDYKNYHALHDSLQHMWDIAHEDKESDGYKRLNLDSSGEPHAPKEVREFIFSILYPLSHKINNLHPSSIEDARTQVNDLLNTVSEKEISTFRTRVSADRTGENDPLNTQEPSNFMQRIRATRKWCCIC